MAKGKGKATGKDEKEEKRTRVVRVPDEIGEMLEAIAQHGLNGWKSVPVVLRDPNCPLKDWLLPLYQRVLKEKAEILESVKES